MTILQAIILGIIQGITEFLPISSSAHLVIIPYLLGWQFPQEQIFPFDVLVQMGTLIATIVYFRNDILDIFKALLDGIKKHKPFSQTASRNGWFLLIATIPAGLVGLLLKDQVENIFNNPPAAAFFLFGTAFLLILAELTGKCQRRLNNLNIKDVLWIGCFQAISIFPGVSRSGACIAGGMTRNVKRKASGKFAFLMSIPIMLAAGAASIRDLMAIPNPGKFLPILIAGFITSSIIGYFAIKWLLGFVNHHSLFAFAIYCILLGLITISFIFIFPKNITAQTTEDAESVIKITYTSNLKWISPIIQTCANQNGDANIIFFENSYSSIESEAYDTIIALDRENIQLNYAFLLGWEDLNLVVNQSNPTQEIPKEQAILLMMGEYATWGDFFMNCESCVFQGDTSNFENKKPIIWFYPSSNVIQETIEKTFFSNRLINPDAKIAPSPENMLQALNINHSALGILPSHWVNNNMKSIDISDIEEGELILPILASSTRIPTGELKDLLICIQESIFP